ncbi:PREDICTED: sulfotransferase 6B1-like [Nanorana parkeri]|uniref:sulfotransferase 6B1-like n=1 Tax=Nanorana parkeri TaxID=125878 RepID=UPI000853F93F|nr:PREDICTED: sulfotransferase 6B1-like [Nanorana parkeri]
MSTDSDLIHFFNGIPFTTRSSAELLKSLDAFQAREDDILLVSYPKSGTHWLAEIMKHLYTAKVTLTSPIEFGDVSKLEEMDNIGTKRIIPTHLGYDMLPGDFKAKKCKAIYIIRNPKDTAVSLFHYYKDNPNLPTIGMWSTYFDMFLQGQVVCGSWFDHILSWEEHRNEMGTLFLYYESMKKNPFKSVRKISSYLGINMNDNEIHEICKKTSFSEMKDNVEKEVSDPNHTVCSLTSNRRLIFRKGTVGEWKQYFSTKQNRLFDELYNTKMNASCLAKNIHYEN